MIEDLKNYDNALAYFVLFNIALFILIELKFEVISNNTQLISLLLTISSVINSPLYSPIKQSFLINSLANNPHPAMGDTPTFSTTKTARNVEISTFSSLLFLYISLYGGGGYSISSDNVNYVTCCYHCIRGCNRCNYWDESISSSSVALSLSATINVLF